MTCFIHDTLGQRVILDAGRPAQLAAERRIARERRVNRHLRGALSGVAVVLVVALAAGVLALRTAERAPEDRDRADAAAALA
jgi:hypothetical protein